jgi:hypothetical protein
MFFRRHKAHKLSFSDRVDRLREFGFDVQTSGSDRARIAKHGCAAQLVDRGEEIPGVSDSGVVIGNEIGRLVNGGFQQFFVTPSGKKLPALAQQLRALHDFKEDLKEALGSISLYNEGLGTTSNAHMYDRVKGRDFGAKNPTGTGDGH